MYTHTHTHIYPSWWTGNPGMLQSMESQRVRHNQVTELNSYYTFIGTAMSLPPWQPLTCSQLE